jgi:hypothetical protein
MKASIVKFLFISLVAVWGCGQKSHDHMNHDHSSEQFVEEGSNDALNTEVMKIHDEAMLKMNDIYTLKQALNSKLADSVKLDTAKREAIKNTISRLDSASEGMMVWMRAFNPQPDSLGAERAREYLETEMEKVKQVREKILEALEEGKQLNN